MTSETIADAIWRLCLRTNLSDPFMLLQTASDFFHCFSTAECISTFQYLTNFLFTKENSSSPRNLVFICAATAAYIHLSKVYSKILSEVQHHGKESEIWRNNGEEFLTWMTSILANDIPVTVKNNHAVTYCLALIVYNCPEDPITKQLLDNSLLLLQSLDNENSLIHKRSSPILHVIELISAIIEIFFRCGSFRDRSGSSKEDHNVSLSVPSPKVCSSLNFFFNGKLNEPSCHKEILVIIENMLFTAIHKRISNEDDVFLLVRRILIPLYQLNSTEISNEDLSKLFDLTEKLISYDYLRTPILLIESLFDIFFQKKSLNDFRSLSTFWIMIWKGLFNEGKWFEEDSSQKIGGLKIQLQALNLLKQVVKLTYEDNLISNREDDSNKKTESSDRFSKLSLPIHVYHPWFMWLASPSSLDDSSFESGTKDKSLNLANQDVNHNSSNYSSPSNELWKIFFLIFDALNEYGLHIIFPALEQLSHLAMSMSIETKHSININNEELKKFEQRFASKNFGEYDQYLISIFNRKSSVVSISFIWVELLFKKMFSHANISVRKSALLTLWGLPIRTLLTFSESFMIKDVAACCSCRQVYTWIATDNESKKDSADKPLSKIGSVSSIPEVSITIEQSERFYQRYFLGFLDNRANQDIAKFICCLLSNITYRSPPFTIITVLRLTRILMIVYQKKILSEPVPHSNNSKENAADFHLLPSELAKSLIYLTRETIGERLPLWLQRRCYMLIFDIMLLSGVPWLDKLLSNESCLTVLSLCGRSGYSGGFSQRIMDICGDTLPGGTLLSEKVLSSRFSQIYHSIRHDILDFRQKGSNVKTNSFTSLSISLDENCGTALLGEYSHSFLSRFKKLLLSFTASNIEFKRFWMFTSLYSREDIGTGILFLEEEFLSSLQRLYASPHVILNCASAFVECYHSFLHEKIHQLISIEFIRQCSDQLFTFMLNLLEWRMNINSCENTIALENSSYDKSVSSNGFSREYIDEIMLPEKWDTLCAALLLIFSLNLSFDGGEIMGRFSNYMESVLAKIKSAENISLKEFSVDQYLLRNAGRILQSLCGSIVVSRRHQHDGLTVTQDISSSAVFFSHFSMDPENIDRLVELLSIQPKKGASFTSQVTNSSFSPTMLMAQYHQFILQSLWITSIILGSKVINQKINEEIDFHNIWNKLYNIALEQFEMCAPCNMSYVVSLLCWIIEIEILASAMKDLHPDRNTLVFHEVSTELRDILTDDHSLVISPSIQMNFDVYETTKRVRNILRELSSTDQYRCIVLYSCMLRYLSILSPEDGAIMIMDELELNSAGDYIFCSRKVFFASLTACLLVWWKPVIYWNSFSSLLCHIAIFGQHSIDGDELISCGLETESLVSAWPCDFAKNQDFLVYHLYSIARSMAISTLLGEAMNNQQNGWDMLNSLFQMQEKNKVICHEPCMINSRTHRCRIRLWQLISSLLVVLDLPNRVNDSKKAVSLIIDKYLLITNLPSVRRLIEQCAIFLLLKCPLYTSILVDSMRKSADNRAQICGSLSLIAFHVLMEAPFDSLTKESYLAKIYSDLFQILIQYSASSHYLVRTISFIGTFHVFKKVFSQTNWELWPISDSLTSLFNYLSQSSEHRKLREKHEGDILFHIHEAMNIPCIFCSSRRDGLYPLSDLLPYAAFQAIAQFDTLMNALVGSQFPFSSLQGDFAISCPFFSVPYKISPQLTQLAVFKVCNLFNELPDKVDRTGSCYSFQKAASDIQSDLAFELLNLNTSNTASMVPDSRFSFSQDISDALIQQKKSLSYSSVIPDMTRCSPKRNRHQSLVIIASFLENPVNIAGLFRCADIFAAESIVIKNRSVLKHPHFIATARSAELWIDWKVVEHNHELKVYLIEKRMKGYSICAVEQASNSIPLNSYCFPEKCVLILGSEGHGIPAWVLPSVDTCIEIPQYGLIGSLNVHVTGGICMYEYTKQHFMTLASSEI